jgi:hypothetical protein
VTFPPRTISEFNRRLDESRLQLAHAPQLQFMQLPPEAPPAPGSLGALEASLRAAAARDLRSGPRRRVDLAWQRVRELVFQQHGRHLPTEVYDCSDAGEESALLAARSAEATYIQLAAAPYVTKETLDSAYDRFAEATAEFSARATKGWLSATDYAAAERRRLDVGW